MTTRESERVSAVADVRVSCDSWGDFVDLYTRDISHGGMFVQTHSPPPLESQVTIRMKLPGDVAELELKGKVVHIIAPERAQGPGQKCGFGVHFGKLDDDTRAAIAALVGHAKNVANEQEGGAFALEARNGSGGGSTTVMASGEEYQLVLQLREELATIKELDDFDVLELRPESRHKDVRTAFFGLSKQWHPDRFQRCGPEVRSLSTHIFIRIKQAYTNLSKPKEFARAHAARAPRGASRPPAEAQQAYPTSVVTSDQAKPRPNAPGQAPAGASAKGGGPKQTERGPAPGRTERVPTGPISTRTDSGPVPVPADKNPSRPIRVDGERAPSRPSPAASERTPARASRATAASRPTAQGRRARGKADQPQWQPSGTAAGRRPTSPPKPPEAEAEAKAAAKRQPKRRVRPSTLTQQFMRRVLNQPPSATGPLATRAGAAASLAKAGGSRSSKPAKDDPRLKEAEERLQEAEENLKERRFTDAIRALEDLMRAEPRPARTELVLEFARAKELAAAGKTEAAIARLEAVLALDPDHRAAKRELDKLRSQAEPEARRGGLLSRLLNRQS